MLPLICKKLKFLRAKNILFVSSLIKIYLYVGSSEEIFALFSSKLKLCSLCSTNRHPTILGEFASRYKPKSCTLNEWCENYKIYSKQCAKCTMQIIGKTENWRTRVQLFALHGRKISHCRPQRLTENDIIYAENKNLKRKLAEAIKTAFLN